MTMLKTFSSSNLSYAGVVVNGNYVTLCHMTVFVEYAVYLLRLRKAGALKLEKYKWTTI